MNLMQATECVRLMDSRDKVIEMRQRMHELPCHWVMSINGTEIPVPHELQRLFKDAVDAAVKDINTKIEKL